MPPGCSLPEENSTPWPQSPHPFTHQTRPSPPGSELCVDLGHRRPRFSPGNKGQIIALLSPAQWKERTAPSSGESDELPRREAIAAA